MGPPSSNLIASEIKAINGESKTRTLATTRRSKSRLKASAMFFLKAAIEILNRLTTGKKARKASQDYVKPLLVVNCNFARLSLCQPLLQNVADYAETL